jgi:hypothetical protein
MGFRSIFFKKVLILQRIKNFVYLKTRDKEI